MSPLSLVLAEDEAAIATLLTYNLENAGFTVYHAADGAQALQLIQDTQPVIALLDWMLPVFSGVELCRQLRQNPATAALPIIMITARGTEEDRIQGLDVGADDYITKPFSPNEVIARIRAVLRRSMPSQRDDAVLAHGDIILDANTHKVRRAGHDIHLGPTEFKLLQHFMQRPEQVFTREDLLKAAWRHDIFVEIRTVDVHIRRLRKALNAHGEDIIRTVRSAGYAFSVEE